MEIFPNGHQLSRIQTAHAQPQAIQRFSQRVGGEIKILSGYGAFFQIFQATEFQYVIIDITLSGIGWLLLVGRYWYLLVGISIGIGFCFFLKGNKKTILQKNHRKNMSLKLFLW